MCRLRLHVIDSRRVNSFVLIFLLFVRVWTKDIRTSGIGDRVRSVGWYRLITDGIEQQQGKREDPNITGKYIDSQLDLLDTILPDDKVG